MTSKIYQISAVLIVYVLSGAFSANSNVHYRNNPFFDQIWNNVWQNQQAINNQNALLQQQIQASLANQQMAFNNQLASIYQNVHQGNYPVNYYNNPFLNGGYVPPNDVTNPTDNTQPTRIPLRPPYVTPVVNTESNGNSVTDESKVTESTTTAELTTLLYIDEIPVIPLTQDEIRR